MAVAEGGQDVTFLAADDQSSTGQFRFSFIDSDGKVDVAAAGEKIAGILQNKPGAADRAATVRINGVSKLFVNGTVGEGDRLESLANGIGSAAGTANGTEWGAIALEAHAGATASIIRVQVIPAQERATA